MESVDVSRSQFLRVVSIIKFAGVILVVYQLYVIGMHM